MKKKIKLLLVSLISMISITSCGNKKTDELKAIAIFYLEGGICQNNTERIMYSYNLANEDSLTYVADPNELIKDDDDEIKRVGYTIEGWYKTKITDGDEVTYKDKWDFKTDKIGIDGVTLYANWKKDITHTYDICYLDEKGNDVVVYSYETEEGSVFKDLLGKANSRSGYTALPGFYDKEGNPWDETFTHPGGDVDTSIKVYAKYIKGEYKLVSTAEELKKSLNKGIYLLNDIDMQGEEICFNDYEGKSINGNGHKIYNFTIKCDPTNLYSNLEDSSSTWSSLYCGLFRKLENSTIENITFEDCKMVVDTNFSKTTLIVVSPFASSISNSTVKNVNFSCDVTVTSKTLNFVNNRNIDYKYIDNQLYAYIDQSSSIENSNISVSSINE